MLYKQKYSSTGHCKGLIKNMQTLRCIGSTVIFRPCSSYTALLQPCAPSLKDNLYFHPVERWMESSCTCCRLSCWLTPHKCSHHLTSRLLYRKVSWQFSVNFTLFFKNETASMQRHVLWALYILKNNNEETKVEASWHKYSTADRHRLVSRQGKQGFTALSLALCLYVPL